MRTISIIGVGRLGGALAIALARKYYEIENLIARAPEKAQIIFDFVGGNLLDFSPKDLSEITSDAIFIATQDFEIENVANALAKNLRTKPFVFHTSGSLSSEILKSLQEIGCKVASFHPLVSISESISGANRFENAYFCIEGDAEAVYAAGKIAADLGGKSFSIAPENKSLYHAAAVTACGHLVALIDAAIEMLSKCGVDEGQSKEILLPLIKSTIENLNEQTTAEALTGTFARADVETFEKHLQVLRENVSQETVEVYLQLGARSAHLAERQGADIEKLAELRKRISLAKGALKC
jgi:predicted short-subunit dehydrogenase-like oxidoreductase (DUF2520 family)